MPILLRHRPEPDARQQTGQVVPWLPAGARGSRGDRNGIRFARGKRLLAAPIDEVAHAGALDLSEVLIDPQHNTIKLLRLYYGPVNLHQAMYLWPDEL